MKRIRSIGIVIFKCVTINRNPTATVILNEHREVKNLLLQILRRTAPQDDQISYS